MTIGAKFGMPTPPPNPYSPIPQVPQMGNMPSVASGMGGMGGMPPMVGQPSPMPMGSPPPVVNPNMGGNAAPRPDLAQRGSNAPRRRMFGDYLEGTLSRNMPSSMPANATSMGRMNVFTGQQMAPQMSMRQRRPMPMPQQRRPMMANDGGIVGFDNGGEVNVFDPESRTYTIRDLESGENEQYSFGSTYGEQDLPADVAYSKQVQENRARLGLDSNDSSAWSLYQRGEHYSQYKPPVVDSVIAEDSLSADLPVNLPVNLPVVANSVSATSRAGGGSFATDGGGGGSYFADPVDVSEINPIDYSQFTGDVGNFSVTPERAAIFGPSVSIPQSVSQFYTDPVSGGLGTTYGSEMVATSPIGAIKLPARPVSLDVFDFLSDPAYGSLDNYDDRVGGLANGGPVYMRNGGNPYAEYAASMREAGIGNLSGKPVTSAAKAAQDRAMKMVSSMNKRDDDDDDDEIIKKYTDDSDMSFADEVIQYTGKSSNDLTGCTRGTSGIIYGVRQPTTTAGTHSSGAKVFGSFVVTRLTRTVDSVSYSCQFTFSTVSNATATDSGSGGTTITTGPVNIRRG